MVDHKDKGNQLFSEKKFDLAVTHYGKAIVSSIYVHGRGRGVRRSMYSTLYVRE